MKKIIPLTLLIVLIDQIIKILVVTNLSLYNSIKVINNFFSITYVKNDGAAWSLFSGNRIFLILVTIVALIFIIKFLIPKKNINKINIISYGLLLGGIIGNFIDRIIFGYVIDYLDFTIFNYNFPVFNFSDSCIVISVFIIIYYEIKGVKHE